MADNTQEEHLENPTNTPPANLPNENIPTTDTETITQNQDTENMEVHKHPHHVTHKKKWSEYLLEFFMLFLAVFCGFLAEYQLEHTIEHQREKKYAELLLSDLRIDSSYFLERNELIENRLKKHRQFYELMNSKVKPTNKEVINLFLPLFYIYDLNVTPATYNQMKTSGSLRYLQNEALISSLQQYYEVMLPKANRRIDVGVDYYSNVIYPYFLKHFRIQDIDDANDSANVAEPVILNRTTETDQELLNIIENYGSDKKNFQARIVEPFTKKNIELIQLLKNEYHLK